MAINFDFYNNDVDPTSQVSFPYYLDGEEDAEYRVMFIGNSITYHERKEEIGWKKDCGMAASDIEHDYVHLVFRKIKERHPLSKICVFNASNWENDNLNEARLRDVCGVIEKFKPNVIVVRIGENFSKENLKNGIDPEPSFEKLFKECKDHSEKTIVTSLFWHHDVLDKAIEEAAAKTGVEYVLISDLGSQDENKALGKYEHQGICGHPGDLGMKRIADRIIEKL